MNTEHHLVVGAGPAGLTAAINLAKRGHKVRVCEQSSAPGFRHRGFQGIESWSYDEPTPHVLNDLGLRPDFLLRPFHEVRFFGPSRQEYFIQSKEPLFHLVRRGTDPDSLDSHLARQAQEVGVSIEYNVRVTTAPPKSIVAVGPKVPMALAKGIVFRTNAPDLAMCIVDFDLAPKAYAYLLVHDGFGTLAAMLTEDFSRAGEALRRSIEAFRRIQPFSIEEERAFGGIGAVNLTGECVVNGHLRVGESAGAQDALWGFGILFAMQSGKLAAECIDGRSDYSQAYRRHLLKRMRRLLVSRWLFERLPKPAIEFLMRRCTESPDPRSYFGRFYGGASWLSLLFPIAKRGFPREQGMPHCGRESCRCIWCRCVRTSDVCAA